MALINPFIPNRFTRKDTLLQAIDELKKGHYLRKYQHDIDRIFHKVGITKDHNCVKGQEIGHGLMYFIAYYAEPKDTTINEKVSIMIIPDRNFPHCRLRLMAEADHFHEDITSDKDQSGKSIRSVLRREIKDLEHGLRRLLKKLMKHELQLVA
ncbi:hypothetical protein H6503_03610 [Candidatus Woesearchaeota archaeon]|nr:hypothetical protein [Candidatus Woesearchaeota archaeon]